ncbi:class I SAM-dependent methyltransferase [Blastococcus sp. CCUG 61487]|uniref:class I SAM-dependent methyltransferase n=1 Tax=Blastococcus sp. CCUG 61487 TaxID=1840703 RepID=UPI0010BFEA50|nr:class I SAM-dependent methyltransferase [Blastococcus sp. CCUG 61487]TKJ20213.1 methyltransferase [Blastococcus sp. CCUG 61487]
MQAADFYTGLVAELYGPLKGARPDAEYCAALVRRHGEPALELGCGDGEPLLDLRRQGLDVEGVDSSADMLARCRQAAADAGLDVVLHRQRMEALDLPRRYRTVFLAGPTFTLLPDDDTAAAALQAVRRHLADDGTAVVPLDVPRPTDPARLGRVREARAADGALLRFSVVAEERDEQRRTQHALLRYERHIGGGSEVVERTWTLHWHTADGFRALAEDAGLAVAAVRGDPAAACTVVLRPAG